MHYNYLVVILLFFLFFVHNVNGRLFIGSYRHVKMLKDFTKDTKNNFIIIQSLGDVYTFMKYIIFFNPNINLPYESKREMFLHEYTHVCCKDCVNHDQKFLENYKKVTKNK